MRLSHLSPESPMNSLEGVEDLGCLWAETVAWVRPRSESDERDKMVLMLFVSNFVQTPTTKIFERHPGVHNYVR